MSHEVPLPIVDRHVAAAAHRTAAAVSTKPCVLCSGTDADLRFTKFGFEWTYEGDSPQQLALAILFDRLANKEHAIALSEPFMKTVIANLDNDWKLTGEEIDAFVRSNPGMK